MLEKFLKAEFSIVPTDSLYELIQIQGLKKTKRYTVNDLITVVARRKTEQNVIRGLRECENKESALAYLTGVTQRLVIENIM